MTAITELTGKSFIGSTTRKGNGALFRGINPATNEPLDPEYGSATTEDVALACCLAAAAFTGYRATVREQRARFLETIAHNISSLGDALIDRAMAESGLPRPRLEGERARTVGQLRLFAEVVRQGSWLGVRVDPALPERKPLPRPDLRLRKIPLGPVAVFGASNFPLAFSVGGGDTASALAAGCPVVVKAHPSHPGTSELVAHSIQDAVRQCGLDEGIFSILFGIGNELGAALVTDPRIKAVAFTGSRTGGLALVELATKRAEPIPVFAEMSSINPVILMPAALEARGPELGKAFIASLTMGAGQFCTNPGLVLAPAGKSLEDFVAAAKEVLEGSAAATMLNAGIFKAYQGGVKRLSSFVPSVDVVGLGQSSAAANQCQAAVFRTSAEEFKRDHGLAEEVFGASSLIVEYESQEALRSVLRTLEGQLTITLHMDAADNSNAQALLPLLEEKAGRILVNGWPTGVEVSHTMVHGGPFPSTSNPSSTSVGTLAIDRFLRPVCYQNFPESLLPEALRSSALETLPRLVDGVPHVPAC